jgi:D-tyrosyl-tRNA(Tyr) deacylase
VKAVVQRVSRARVTVGDEVTGEIGQGLLVLLGVAEGDPPEAEATLANKIAGLRIFQDDAGKMNLAVGDVGGAVLVVSQFTLLADCRKGRRPSFTGAATPDEADRRYEGFCSLLRAKGLTVATGRFGASMDVELVNQGPVTILLDTAELLSPRRSSS